MDDNNQEDGKVITNVKKATKGVFKVVGGFFRKTIIIAILAVTIFIIINVGGAYILFEDWFKTVSSSGNKRNSTAQASSNGITTSMTAKEVYEEIKEKMDNIKSFCTEEQLEYLMNAELVTQYPYIENIPEGNLNGIIKFYRDINQDGKISDDERIEYVDKDKFNEYIQKYQNSGNKEVLKYFTYSENGNIKIAYISSEIRTITTDDFEINQDNIKKYDFEIGMDKLEEESNYSYVLSKTNQEGNKEFVSRIYTIETKEIEYKSLASNYVMPFDFLAALLVTTENIDFVTEIAGLAYNSKIDLSILDGTTISKSNYEYTYKKKLTELTDASINITNVNDISYINRKYSELDKESIEIWKANNQTQAEEKKVTDEFSQSVYYIKKELNGAVDSTNNIDEAQNYTTKYAFEKEVSLASIEKKEVVSWAIKENGNYSYSEKIDSGETIESDEKTATERIKSDRLSRVFNEETVKKSENQNNISVGKANKLLDTQKTALQNSVKQKREERIQNLINSNFDRVKLVQWINNYFRTSEIKTSNRLADDQINANIVNNIIEIVGKMTKYTDIDLFVLDEGQEDVIFKITQSQINDMITFIYTGDNEEEIPENINEVVINIYKSIVKVYVENEIGTETVVDGKITNVNSDIYVENVEIVAKQQEDNISNRFISSPSTVSGNTGTSGTEKTFIDIFNKSDYSRERSLLKGVDGDWMFDWLEESESTADKIDLIKYMMQEATGNDYGIDGYNFGKINKTYSSNATGCIYLTAERDTYHLTEKEFCDLLRSYVLSDKGKAAAFKVIQDNAEIIYNECLDNHLNPIFCVVQAVMESGWGSSKIAINKHNYWGINATDPGAYEKATTYQSFEDCLKRGWIGQCASKYLDTSSWHYSKMMDKVNRFSQVDSRVTAYSAYAIASVHTGIDGKPHGTEYGGGNYKTEVIGKCLINNNYIKECNHDLSDPISEEELTAYALFCGDKYNKVASQIWGDRAFTGLSKTNVTNNNIKGLEEKYVLINEEQEEKLAQMIKEDKNNADGWQIGTYTNSRGDTYIKYYNYGRAVDIAYQGYAKDKNDKDGNTPVHSCGMGAMAIALSKFSDVENVSPYTISQKNGRWVPLGGSYESDMKRYASYFGYNYKYFRTNSCDGISEEIDKGNSIIVDTPGGKVYDSKLGKWIQLSSGGHYVALVDYKVIDGTKYFYIINPNEYGNNLDDFNYRSEKQNNGNPLYLEGWISEQALRKLMRRYSVVYK